MAAADEFEVVEGQPVSREGDLWRLGSHRLLCGNALASTSYDALLAGEKAAAAFTDPPYNVPVNGHVGGKGKRKRREFLMATGEMSDDAFSQFLLGFLELVALHSVEDATFFACIDLPLNFHPAALRASAGLVCSPTLDRRKVEFSGLCQAGGLDTPAGVMREPGGLLPIAPCGRSSL
jgi:hypothetical protein